MKLTTILLTSILGLGAMTASAKDLSQISSELNALQDKTSRIAYVQENIGDIVKAYPSWVEGGRQTYTGRPFVVAYHCTDAFDGLSDYEKACISARKLGKTKAVTNPNWYDEIKEGGFILEGKKLEDCQVFELAATSRDDETLEAIIKRCPTSLLIGENFKVATRTLLSMQDTETAIRVLNAMQTQIAIRNATDPRLDTLKSYIRIVRENSIYSKLK